MPSPHICLGCRIAVRVRLSNRPNASNTLATSKRFFARPSLAPKPVLDLKHIRQNPGLYEQNCIDRNYAASAQNGWRMLEFH
jgi:seryl-tRNA synthetase